MAKPKRDPIEQGYVKEIYKRFIAPLVKYKPDVIPLKDWMQEGIFHNSTRDITRYQAIHGFEMPGLLNITSNQKVQGIGERTVYKGHIMFVRHDSTMPDVYEVETNGGHGQYAQLWTLTEAEWDRIRPKVQEMERKKK